MQSLEREVERSRDRRGGRERVDVDGVTGVGRFHGIAELANELELLATWCQQLQGTRKRCIPLTMRIRISMSGRRWNPLWNGSAAPGVARGGDVRGDAAADIDVGCEGEAIIEMEMPLTQSESN